MLALLAGLHEPTAGRVLVDGADTAALGQDERGALVSVVFQQPYPFDGTIRDNVLAGDPGAGEDRLGHAVALARVDKVTARLPDGEGTAVGEAGTALSGGERQRVSIARALLKPAPILLVDEATSALDTENEAAVVRALADDTTPRTRVLVAHRLSSIRHADRVVFLEDGRVVEDGTVEGLLAARRPARQILAAARGGDRMASHLPAAGGRWRLLTKGCLTHDQLVLPLVGQVEAGGHHDR